MANRLFWFDVETTGLSAWKHAIVELAFLIEECDGTLIEKGHFKLAPHKGALVTPKACEVHGHSLEAMRAFPDPGIVFKDLIGVLSRFIDPYDKNDKLILAGYNVNFDDDFLRSLWRLNGDKFYGSWFYSCKIDVMTLVAMWLASEGKPLANYQLKTVCAEFDINFHAHDALEDIRATRELYYKLIGTRQKDKNFR